MPVRSINSPGVEIFEIDKSQVAPAIVGTNFYVMGYTDKGEEYVPTDVPSTEDFLSMYGAPTNEAERYSYYAANDVIKNGGNLVFAKLPYNSTMASNYKAIGLEYDGTSPTLSSSNEMVKSISGYFDNVATFTFSLPVNINNTTFSNIQAQNGYITTDPAISGAIAGAEFLIINTNKAPLGGISDKDGIFVAYVDVVDAIVQQRMLSGSYLSNDNPMSLFLGLSADTTEIEFSNFVTAPTGTYVGDSISEQLMAYFPTVEFSGNGDVIDPYYSKHIGILVCNSTSDPQTDGKSNVSVLEAYAGSIYQTSRDPANGQSNFICNIVNAQSQYVRMYPMLVPSTSGYIQELNDLPADNDNTACYIADAKYNLLSFTDADAIKTIAGGQMVTNMKIAMEKVSNVDDRQLDVIVDAGISTIAGFTDDPNGTGATMYDPSIDMDTDDVVINSSVSTENWRAVCTELISFCKDIRKDCMTVLDVPRNLVIEGNEKFIRAASPTNTFSNTIGKRLRYVTGLNSSYAALYSNWSAVIDGFSGLKFWLPASINAAGIYANNDRTGNIWDAPAGLNRGIINGIVDLAFNPNRKESDQLYTKSINYAKQYPLDGFILEGQKTTQAKPSAFDRVNVRRLFLRLERLVYNVSRYFVLEPNNAFTRQRLLDVLTPIFQAIKISGGIYSYQLVCDERNNPAEVIDRNELKVLVMVKPVRTAEFILVTFVATRTDANFEELVSELALQ